jgi:hypothetical protein
MAGCEGVRKAFFVAKQLGAGVEGFWTAYRGNQSELDALYFAAQDDLQNESWQMVPRKDRPSPEELIDYVGDPDFEPDPDYSEVRIQRALWLRDYHRREEQKREQGNDKSLPGHDEDPFQSQGNRHGFDREAFFAKAARNQ